MYVTGRSVGSGTNLDYATVAYDAATGDQGWVARYDGPANGEHVQAKIADFGFVLWHNDLIYSQQGEIAILIDGIKLAE